MQVLTFQSPTSQKGKVYRIQLTGKTVGSKDLEAVPEGWVLVSREELWGNPLWGDEVAIVSVPLKLDEENLLSAEEIYRQEDCGATGWPTIKLLKFLGLPSEQLPKGRLPHLTVKQWYDGGMVTFWWEGKPFGLAEITEDGELGQRSITNEALAEKALQGAIQAMASIPPTVPSDIPLFFGV